MSNIDLPEPPREKVCRPDISIQLTEKESQLFSILLNANNELHLDSTLRVAGGWVRDKIIGKTCHDIDIAIDNMTGYEYVRALPEWLLERGYMSSNIGKIKANPEKSKHLETATIRILDMDIDFVNLRKEEYMGDSRIPIISIGTPWEDAYRRDLTVNSLFYNINEAVIEDYTLRGVDDLFNRLAKTPLPARQTFIDDPLRILRTIRFATRYGLEIDGEIMETVGRNATGDIADKHEILDSLARKVSKERVGVEVLKMVQEDCNFLRAVNLLEEMELINCIFNLECDMNNYMRTQRNRSAEEFYDTLFLIQIPTNALDGMRSLEGKTTNLFFEGSSCASPAYRIQDSEDILPITSDVRLNCSMVRHRKYFSYIFGKTSQMKQYVECFERFKQTYNLFSNPYLQSIMSEIEEGPLATIRLACLLYPFKYQFVCGEMQVISKKKQEMVPTVLSPLVKHFVRESLKLKNTMIDNVGWIVHREHELRPYLEASFTSIPIFSEEEQIVLGNLLLKSKGLWPLVLIMNAIDMMLTVERDDAKVIQACENLICYIREKEMDQMWLIPSIINGNELNELGVEKGPKMREMMETIRDWMIIHPHGTREECIAEVIQK